MRAKSIKLYTDNHSDVTEWIKTGRTFLFSNIFDARKKAQERHSYHYEVHDAMGVRVGWAVPK